MALISGRVRNAVLPAAWNEVTAKTLLPVLLKIQAAKTRVPTSVKT
jgi:hypothetical protein